MYFIRDDGSSDNTVRIINERIRRGDGITLIEGINIGFAMSFMALVDAAFSFIDEYDYYAFCDQDDVWLPLKLFSAVSMLKERGMIDKPNLYWSNFTLVDENLQPIHIIPLEDDKTQVGTRTSSPTMTKPTILVRYFMLGCTMVFDKNMVSFIHEHQPKNKLTMHDLWLSQTAIYFGHVVFDNRSFLLYRQHGGNAAGVDNSLKGRWKRFIKSFRTYERRHFREINAKNLLSTYQGILTKDDCALIESVANYRTSIKKRLHLLFNRDINMGSFTSDLFIKIRIILGVF